MDVTYGGAVEGRIVLYASLLGSYGEASVCNNVTSYNQNLDQCKEKKAKLLCYAPVLGRFGGDNPHSHVYAVL